MDKIRTVLADSREIPVSSRLDWWQAAAGNVFDVTPSSFVPSPARAEEPHRLLGSWWHHDKLILSSVSYSPARAVRPVSRLRADQLDHYRLILIEDGAFQVEANGQQQVVRSGDLLLHDMARPAEYDGAGSSIALVVPREMLDEELPYPLDLHGVRLRGAASNLLAAHLKQLTSYSPEVSAAETPILARATMNLLAASIVPSADTFARASKAVETTLLRQLCRYVDLHLAEPDLSAEQLARFFGVSRSAVYRIFEPMHGVAAFIKERRLARVHDLLSQSSKRWSIGQLADDHGFKSVAHFSRAFREQYGYSPSDLRNDARHAAMTLKKYDSSHGLNMYSWIRSLRD